MSFESHEHITKELFPQSISDFIGLQRVDSSQKKRLLLAAQLANAVHTNNNLLILRQELTKELTKDQILLVAKKLDGEVKEFQQKQQAAAAYNRQIQQASQPKNVSGIQSAVASQQKQLLALSSRYVELVRLLEKLADEKTSEAEKLIIQAEVLDIPLNEQQKEQIAQVQQSFMAAVTPVQQINILREFSELNPEAATLQMEKRYADDENITIKRDEEIGLTIIKDAEGRTLHTVDNPVVYFRQLIQLLQNALLQEVEAQMNRQLGIVEEEMDTAEVEVLVLAREITKLSNVSQIINGPQVGACSSEVDDDKDKIEQTYRSAGLTSSGG